RPEHTFSLGERRARLFVRAEGRNRRCRCSRHRREATRVHVGRQRMEAGMRGLVRTLAVLSAVLLLPAATSAQQASISGVIKDASGAVLPGVSVEATSPALTEKVRAVVSDGT